MVKNKSFTDLEQCRKLATILPPESADMCYIATADDDKGDYLYTAEYKSEFIFREDDEDCISCWSLAALLNYLRDIDLFPDISVDEDSVTMSIDYFEDEDARLLIPMHNVTIKAETFVDACYDFILKLHKH